MVEIVLNIVEVLVEMGEFTHTLTLQMTLLGEIDSVSLDLSVELEHLLFVGVLEEVVRFLVPDLSDFIQNHRAYLRDILAILNLVLEGPYQVRLFWITSTVRNHSSLYYFDVESLSNEIVLRNQL